MPYVRHSSYSFTAPEKHLAVSRVPNMGDHPSPTPPAPPPAPGPVPPAPTPPVPSPAPKPCQQERIKPGHV